MHHAHYVRFARSLALTTTLLIPTLAGCGGDSTAEGDNRSAGPQSDQAATSHDEDASAASPTGTSDALQADAAAPDGALEGGRISGPLPPPELPASFA